MEIFNNTLLYNNFMDLAYFTGIILFENTFLCDNNYLWSTVLFLDANNNSYQIDFNCTFVFQNNVISSGNI